MTCPQSEGGADADCARAELSIAAGSSAPLSKEEASFLSSHIARCRRCREAALDPPLAEELGPAEVSTDTYVLGAEIGRGGMGRVLSARDRRSGRAVALKEVLATDPVTLERFEREARITTQLQHPGIVSVYEVGRWPDGRPFYSMPILPGRTLREAIAGARSPTERLHLIPAVLAAADAIAYAHDRGVIHRDLTPSNIVLGSFGETIVIDWGVAKDLNEEESADSSGEALTEFRSNGSPGLTAAGSVIGTPAYISPEQADGRPVDERADVYALGAILYHLLTGRPPYGGAGPETVVARLRAQEPPTFIVDKAIPRDLMSVARKAMDLDPTQRYGTAQALVEDLRRYQQGEKVRAHRYSRRELTARWLARRVRLVVAGSVTLLLASTGAAVVGMKVTRLQRRAADTASELLKIRGELGIPAFARNGHPRADPIKGWVIAGSHPDDYDMGLDQSVSWKGRPSAYVKAKRPLEPGGFGTLMQMFAPDAYLGKRVRFSAYVKSSRLDSWAGLWMRVDAKGSHDPLAFDNMENRPIKGTTDWQRYEVVLDVPREAAAIALGILVAQSGAVWMNGLQVEVVEQNVPSTDMLARAAVGHPRNLDFSESSTVPSEIPEAWIRGGDRPDDYEMGVDRKNLYRGRPTAHLKSKVDKVDGFSTLAQAVSARGYRGRRLRLSAEVQATDVKDWAGLWMRVDGAGGNPLAFDNMAERPITGTSPWRNYQVVLDVPSEAQNVVFGVLLKGPGEVSIGDVKVEALDSSPAVTSENRAKGPSLELAP